MNTEQQQPTKKSTCAMDGCTDRPVKIIGDCKFCQRKFCSRHRQVELHHCPNMQACRDQHFQNNQKKLSQEKTVSQKTI